MREERLVIFPFDDLKVFEFNSVKQVNEHACAEIKGMVPFEQRKNYENLGKKKLWVQIMAVSTEKEVSLFYGVVKRLSAPGKGRIV